CSGVSDNDALASVPTRRSSDLTTIRRRRHAESPSWSSSRPRVRNRLRRQFKGVHSMKRALKVLGLGLIMALIAACGGGEGAGTDATTTTEAASRDVTTTTVADTTTTTAADVDDDDDDDDDTGGDFSAGSCFMANRAWVEAMERQAQMFDDDDIDYEVAIAQIHAAADTAPPEIRSDFKIFAEEVEKLYRAMAD